MKKIFFVVCIIFSVTQVFAQDEGRLKIKTGYEWIAIGGSYDDEGEYDYTLSLPTVYSILLEVSYEVIDGLEPEVKLRYDIIDPDSDCLTGINRPVVGIKYTSPIGLGGFVDMCLPFGSQDIVGEEPEIGLYFALFFDTLFYGFTLYTEVLFDMQFEGEDDTAQNQLRLIIRPGYMILKNLEVYFETQIEFGLGVTFDGSAVDDSSGYLLRLKSGAVYQVTERIELEGGLSFTMCGESASNIPGFIAWHRTLAEISATFSLF